MAFRATHLKKALRTLDGEQVRIVRTENIYILESGGTRVGVRVLDTTFPEYQRVIPKDYSTRVLVPRE